MFASILQSYQMQNINQEGPPSLVKYQPPLDITHKLAAYQQKLYQPSQSQTKPSNQDLLNIMLPPRQYTKRQHHFLQYVSHAPPGRDDVENISKNLESALIDRQARNQGICPIKEQLISQTFDQIIRQVTLDSPERGLMLLRVRDQRKMTIAAHQTVYQAGISYGQTKQTESQQGMLELQGQINALSLKAQELKKKLAELQSKKESMQQKYRERNTVQLEKRQYQLKAMISQNEHLESFLSSRRKNIQEVVEPSAPEEEQEK